MNFDKYKPQTLNPILYEADEAEMVQNFKMDLEDFVKGTGLAAPKPKI